MSVSYTHLDVYKRQYWSIIMIEMKIWVNKVKETTKTWGNSRPLAACMVIMVTQLSPCLLYTSDIAQRPKHLIFRQFFHNLCKISVQSATLHLSLIHILHSRT